MTAEQVTAFHLLAFFLRKAGVIGLLTTRTVTDTLHEYKIVVTDYDPAMKGKITRVEYLERYFIESLTLGRYVAGNALRVSSLPSDSDES